VVLIKRRARGVWYLTHSLPRPLSEPRRSCGALGWTNRRAARAVGRYVRLRI